MSSLSLSSFLLLLLSILLHCTSAIRSSDNAAVPHREHEFTDDEIIQLPIGRFPEPQCRYSVHWGDSDGREIIGSVQIGDPLYHKWQCEYERGKPTMYCMMVHNCTVSSDGGRTVVPIIDEFGCTLFPLILPHVVYANDLDGGLRANAFSLDIDKPAVFFQCNIKLLIKLNGICRRPQCIPLEWYQRRQQQPAYIAAAAETGL